MPILDSNLTSKTGIKTTKKIVMLDPDPRVDQTMKTTTIFDKVWTMDLSLFGSVKVDFFWGEK